jgi:DNA-directed RNA polymerase specialized sigma24 family protein
VDISDEWDRRLRNWARWLAAGQIHLGYISPVYALALPGPRSGFRAPILEGEASDTDRLVAQLPRHLRRALILWYCGRGTREQMARQAGCSRSTLQERVECAKRTLREIRDQRAQIRDHSIRTIVV